MFIIYYYINPFKIDYLIILEFIKKNITNIQKSNKDFIRFIKLINKKLIIYLNLAKQIC